MFPGGDSPRGLFSKFAIRPPNEVPAKKTNGTVDQWAGGIWIGKLFERGSSGAFLILGRFGFLFIVKRMKQQQFHGQG